MLVYTGLVQSHEATHKTSWPLQLNCQAQASQPPLCHLLCATHALRTHLVSIIPRLSATWLSTTLPQQDAHPPCISHPELTEDQSAVCASKKI